MFLEFEPGDYVINPKNRSWGIGQIQSIIKNKIVLDTTNISVEESLDEFKIKIVPFLTENDKNRMAN